jgi:polyphosphate glucokinase
VRRALERRLGKPVRVINDADLQALAAARGEGVELLLTLGTGVGAAWLVDGRLGANLELGHHIFAPGKTYEQFVARTVLDRIGKRKWRRRVARIVAALAPVFNYRRLYLGGGNAKHLDPAQLPADVTVVPNAVALMAGLGPWLAADGEAPLCLRAAGLRLHAPR